MTFSTTSPRAAITAADITILPEFQNLIPPLSAEELDQLQNSICADGCIDPLIVWKGKGILLDGHNRYAYCKANGIEFRVHELRFSDHNEARNWIILNQLGRRNLSPEAATILRGKLYNAAKKAVSNPDGLGGKSGKIDEGKSCPQQTTAAQIAAKTGVSERTIKNDGAFVEACDTLGITQAVMAGKLDAPRAAVIEVAKSLPEKPSKEQVRKAALELGSEKKKRREPWFENVTAGIASHHVGNLVRRWWNKCPEKHRPNLREKFIQAVEFITRDESTDGGKDGAA